ncbi:MAG: hypothetical protein DRP79_09830 [Planctomycetota bacterium]|nr:MAG: hypothetical protein DRP79_09830 [Planctomycetota bacterium]
MRINVNAAPEKEWGEFVGALCGNLENIDAILEHFKGSRAYAGLVAFSRTVNRLSRGEFLRGLHSFLEKTMQCEAQVVCSVGAGITGSRQVALRGTGCEGFEPDEHLIVNLYGASSAGNLIPLVVFNDDDVELEGIINVVPTPDAPEDTVRREVLHSLAQMLALIFRNLKLVARLAEICPKRKMNELNNILKSYRGDTEGLTLRLRAIGAPAARSATGVGAPRKPGIAARLLRLLRSKAGLAMTLLALILSMALASYAKIEPLNQPFNYAAAGVGKITLKIPFHATKKALDDGLLRVMVDTRDPRQIHDWLKGGNPGSIDYEEVLMENGWDNEDLHRLGRVLGMVP